MKMAIKFGNEILWRSKMELQKRTVNQAILTILIVVFGCVLLLLCCGAGVYAESADDFSFESVRAECKELTDDDVLEGAPHYSGGEKMDLEGYFDFLDERFYYDYPELQNIYIWRLIPKELFRHVGEWFYNGAGYSFYINTINPVPDREYYSDVAFIDNFYGFDQKSNEITVKLSVKAYHYKSYYDLNKVFRTDYNGNMTKNEYYITDVQLFTVLENEHALNCTDEGYDKFEDDGTIITQTRVNYGGLCEKYDSSSAADILKGGLKFALGKIPVAGNLYKAYNTMWAVTDKLKDICYEERTVDIESNNEKNIHTLPTKETQLQSEQEGLIRSVIASPADRGIMVNNYVEMITLINGAEPVRASVGAFYRLLIKSTHDSYIVAYENDNNTQDACITLFDTFSADPDRYLPLGYLHNDLFYDEGKIYDAREGANAGYLLASDSVQNFVFSPSRNGAYIISAGNNVIDEIREGGEVVELTDDGKCKLICGKKYYIDVSCADENMDHNKYDLEITFDPEIFEGDMHEIEVNHGETEYLKIIPDKTGVYEFSLSEKVENMNFGIIDPATDYVEAVDQGTHDLSAYLIRNKVYYFEINNSVSAVKKVCVNKRYEDGIQIGDRVTETPNKRKVYVFTPAHNGDYSFYFYPSSDTDVTVRDSGFQSIKTSRIKTSGSIELYCAAGNKYYIDIEAISANTHVITEVKFTPHTTNGENITVDNISDYNIVGFIPEFSSKYELSMENDPDAQINIYTDVGANVTHSRLNKNEKYFIVVSSSKNIGMLTFALTGDVLLHNKQYTVTGDSATLVFTPTISGVYTLVGIDKFKITDKYLNMLYDETANKLDLLNDKEYYILFDRTDSESTVSVRFSPNELPLYGNVMVFDKTYFVLMPPESMSFTFDITINSQYDVVLYLYDADFNLIDSFPDGLSIYLNTGVYYVFADITNTKMTLSIRNDKQIGADLIRCEEGIEYTHTIEADTSLIFEYDYTKSEAQCEFVIMVSRPDSADMHVKVYYYDASNSIRYVDCLMTEYDTYFTFILEKSVGKYYIEIQGAIQRTLLFRLYVPTVIENIFIDNYNVKDSETLYLGISCTYEFRIVCNSTATYGVTMRLGQNLNGVSISGFSVSVSNLPTLVGKSIEIIIESMELNNGKRPTLKTYTFVIKQPYVASCNIYDNKFRVRFENLYGVPVSDVYSKIEYSYIWNGTEYDLDGAGDTADLVGLPNVEAVNVYARIQYKHGYTETVDCLYTEVTYSLRDSINTNGKKRLLIDARSDYNNSPKEIVVPKNIVTLNMKGGFSYYGVNIVIANDRTLPLSINLDRFDYTSNTVTALYYSGNQHVYLRLYGNCKIETNQKYAHGIDIPNLTIIGGGLEAVGGGAETGSAWTAAGSGIKATNLTIEDCNLIATGGKGYSSSVKNNGKAGVHGGNGITVNSLTVKNSVITAHGGNGSDGASGTIGSAGTSAMPGGLGGNGGAGGNGGYGIYTQKISVTGSSFKLYGGNGGAGGKGGSGGSGGTVNTGGKGGNGGKYGDSGKGCNIAVNGAETSEGNLGYGGAGGTGGSGTKGGAGGNGYFSDCGSGGTGSKSGNGVSGSCVPDNFKVSVSGQGKKIPVYFNARTTVTFYTTNNSGDPYLELYDSSGVLTVKDDNGNGGLNASLKCVASARRQYTLVARAASNGSATFTIGAKTA